MARWTLKNYNVFLREAKRRYGVTHREAQAIYRLVKERAGRPVFSTELPARKPYRRKPKRPPTVLPPGTELEMTATTRGGTPRRRKGVGRRIDARVLALKIRFVLREDMTTEGKRRG